MRTFSIFAMCYLILACATSQHDSDDVAAEQPDYPQTRRGDVVDRYFDVSIPDPYRWLEDDRSEETGEWVKDQNRLTSAYLDKIPFRKDLKTRLQASWHYEKVSAPFTEGDYKYFYKNDGLQDQAVVYRQKAGGDPQVFLDPNTLSEDGTTSLAQLSFSRDGSLAAYSVSEGGSDWRKIVIIDVHTKKELEPRLLDVKFSGINWFRNEGFYYSSYDKPQGSELSARTDQHKLYYHRLGQPQSEDQLVFGGTASRKRRCVFVRRVDSLALKVALWPVSSFSGGQTNA